MSATKEHYHNQIEQEIRIASQSPVAIEKMAEEYADSQERRGCAYWNGLYRGFIAGFEEISKLKSA